MRAIAKILLAAVCQSAFAKDWVSHVWHKAGEFKKHVSELKKNTYNDVVADMEVSSPAEILDGGRAVTVDSCSTAEHALKVDTVHFNDTDNTVRVQGSLAKEVHDGKVSATIELGNAPSDASLKEKLKRRAAFGMATTKVVEESLCSHFQRSGKGCPLPAGKQDLVFSFSKLPSVVVAGSYTLKLSAADLTGVPIVCLTGGLNVARSKTGKMFRRVQSNNHDTTSTHGDHAVVSSAKVALPASALISLVVAAMLS